MFVITSCPPLLTTTLWLPWMKTVCSLLRYHPSKMLFLSFFSFPFLFSFTFFERCGNIVSSNSVVIELPSNTTVNLARSTSLLQRFSVFAFLTFSYLSYLFFVLIRITADCQQKVIWFQPDLLHVSVVRLVVLTCVVSFAIQNRSTSAPVLSDTQSAMRSERCLLFLSLTSRIGTNLFSVIWCNTRVVAQFAFGELALLYSVHLLAF